MRLYKRVFYKDVNNGRPEEVILDCKKIWYVYPAIGNDNYFVVIYEKE